MEPASPFILFCINYNKRVELLATDKTHMQNDVGVAHVEFAVIVFRNWNRFEILKQYKSIIIIIIIIVVLSHLVSNS